MNKTLIAALTWLGTGLEAGVIGAGAVAALHGGNFASWDVLAAGLVAFWKTAAAHLKDSPFASLEPAVEALQRAAVPTYPGQGVPPQGGFATVLFLVTLIGALVLGGLASGCVSTATKPDPAHVVLGLESGAAAVVRVVRAAEVEGRATHADTERAIALAKLVRASVDQYVADSCRAPAASAPVVCETPDTAALVSAMTGPGGPMTQLQDLATKFGGAK